MGLVLKFFELLRESDSIVLLSVAFGIALILLFFSKKNDSKGKRKEMDTSRSAEIKESSDEEESDLSKIVPSKWEEDTAPHIPYNYKRFSSEESLKRAEDFYNLINARRSIRFFSKENVDKAIIERIIHTAGTAPSGAHTEPWTFVAIRDQEIKENLRHVVETEEEINYAKRMGKQWVKDLEFLKTTFIKEYITEAPWMIAVFRQAYFPLPGGKRRVHYYNEISTSVSCGLLLAAIQNAGLVTVTTTPLNCGPAMRRILDRPKHEKLVFLLPVGYPAPDATVPDLSRKPLSEIMVTI